MRLYALQAAEPEPGKTICRSSANGNVKVRQKEMSNFSKSLTETTTETTTEITTEISTETDIEDINNNKKNLSSHHRRPVNKYSSGRYGRLVRT